MQIHSQRHMRTRVLLFHTTARKCSCIPGVVVLPNRIARDRRTLTCEFAVLRSHLGRTTNDRLMLADIQTPSQIATRFPRQASSRGGLLYLKVKVTCTSTALKIFSFHRLWTSDKRRQCARSRVLPKSSRNRLNSDARASRLCIPPLPSERIQVSHPQRRCVSSGDARLLGGLHNCIVS